MSDRNPPPHDQTTKDRRTPLANDIDPDGMDAETEGDPIDASADEDTGLNGPDGTADPGPPGSGPDHRRV